MSKLLIITSKEAFCQPIVHHSILTNPQTRLPQRQLRQVIDYINDHLTEDLGLTKLAVLVHMSPHYFSRLFKQFTGLSPHQYVIRSRVERARKLLLLEKLSIAEIACHVGFANQSHLNRHFKRWFGVTPKAMRLS